LIPRDIGCDSDQGLTAEATAKRILVVDDDPVIRKVLKRLFESEGYVVDVQRDGKAALKAFHSATPAAIILDLRLPAVSGQEVCREIRRTSSTVPIIVLSAVADLVVKIRLLHLGADDYVTKPFSPHELLARLRAIIRDTRKSNDSSLASFDGVSIDFLKMNASLDDKPVQLTVQEFKLLKFFLERAERVVSREEIVREAFGSHGCSYSRTVDNCVLKLRQKLERDPANPLHFRTAHGIGYRFVP
jgi:DNA-binding response OmpR family regulator